MKKTILIATSLVTVTSLMLWKNLSTEPTYSALLPAEKSSRPATRTQIAIKIPTAKGRALASQTPHNDPSAFLSAWWENFSSEQRQNYTMKLENKTTRREIYQVYYQNQKIDSLVIVRKLNQDQSIEPFPVFQVAAEHDLIDRAAGESSIRATEPQSTEITWQSQVWILSANQTLHPAYKYSVKIKEKSEAQTWTINARSGEVMTINAHERH